MGSMTAEVLNMTQATVSLLFSPGAVLDVIVSCGKLAHADALGGYVCSTLLFLFMSHLFVYALHLDL